jgi:hypothetical protein
MNRDDKNAVLADDESPYKYTTGNEKEAHNKNEKQSDEQMSVDTESIVDEAIREFVNDSLWQETLRPGEAKNSLVDSEDRIETSGYRDDMLYMKEDTTTAEVIDFMRRCIETPVVAHGKIVWNFSTHEIDEEAIKSLEDKEQDRFVIPYQVTGAWGYMFSLLPEEIRESEILVYDPSNERYMAYRSLYRTTADERIDQIRKDLSRRVVTESGDILGLLE